MTSRCQNAHKKGSCLLTVIPSVNLPGVVTGSSGSSMQPSSDISTF